MFVLVELADLLLNDLEVVGVELVHQEDELGLAVFYEEGCFGASIDHLGHCFEMLHGHMGELFWIAGLNRLQLDAHQHQVKELLHAALVQSHYGGVCQSDEDLPRLDQRVHRLRSKHFLDELLGQHRLHNILEYLLASLSCHILRSEPLVQDVDHLSSKRNDDERQSVHIW